jgi:hypothetical protein
MEIACAMNKTAAAGTIAVVRHNSFDMAGRSPEKVRRYACRRKLAFASASYVLTPLASWMHSFVNGMKKLSRAFGEWGPGMTPMGIKFSSLVRISGGRL